MVRRNIAVSVSLVVLSVCGVIHAPLVHADATNGDIFYTTFSGADRVFKRSYTFDGTTLTYGSDVVISSLALGLGGSDGIVFDPTDTNFLLIGGQNGRFYRVDAGTGLATGSSDFSGVGATIFHLVVDPNATSVWGTGIPDSPAVNLGLSPFNVGGSVGGGASTVVPIVDLIGSNGDTSITGLAFVPGGLTYYTSSGPGGVGSFGTIDLTTGETTRIASPVPAAHGLSYDSFTGHLILVGDSEISQFNPGTGLFVSTLSLSGNQFDQGTVDGKGHLFVASNDGDMLFLDYSASSLVGSGTNFSDLRFFRANLDDVAPLSGQGSHQPIPEPASILLFGLGGLSAGFVRRRKGCAASSVWSCVKSG